MNGQKFMNYKWMRVVLPSAAMPWLYQGATNTLLCASMEELYRCLTVLCVSVFSYQSSGTKAVPVAFQTTR